MLIPAYLSFVGGNGPSSHLPHTVDAYLFLLTNEDLHSMQGPT